MLRTLPVFLAHVGEPKWLEYIGIFVEILIVVER